MHEFSLVEALIERIEAHAPPDRAVLRVRVRAGAGRAIEPDLMQWAWRAATEHAALDGATLELEIQPYRLHCPACGASFESEYPLASCACGCEATRPEGGDELTLRSITLSDDERPHPCPEPRKEVSR